jgi:hypothetical protein
MPRRSWSRFAPGAGRDIEWTAAPFTAKTPGRTHRPCDGRRPELAIPLTARRLRNARDRTVPPARSVSRASQARMRIRLV